MQRQQEIKYTSSVAGSAQIPIAGAAIVDGFGPYMSQGDARDTREGNKITVRSLAMRFNVKLGALEADGTSVRLLVVYDRRPLGADAVVTNMLWADDILSLYNTAPEYRGRFQFLADRTIQFSAQEGEWNDKFFIRRNFTIEYNGNAGTVADVEKGNFLVVGLSRGNAAAIDIDFSFVFKFTDA